MIMILFVDGEVVVDITAVAKMKFTENVQEKHYFLYFIVVQILLWFKYRGKMELVIILVV